MVIPTLDEVLLLHERTSKKKSCYRSHRALLADRWNEFFLVSHTCSREARPTAVNILRERANPLPALKGRKIIAQGNALGRGTNEKMESSPEGAAQHMSHVNCGVLSPL